MIPNEYRKLYRKAHAQHQRTIPLLNTYRCGNNTVCDEPALLTEEWQAHRGYAFRLMRWWPYIRGEGPLPCAFTFRCWPQLISAIYLPVETTSGYFRTNGLTAAYIDAPQRSLEEDLEVSLSVETPRIPYDRIINGQLYRRIECFYPFLLPAMLVFSEILLDTDATHIYVEGAFLSPERMRKLEERCQTVWGLRCENYQRINYDNGILTIHPTLFTQPIYDQNEIAGWKGVDPKKRVVLTDPCRIMNLEEPRLAQVEDFWGETPLREKVPLRKEAYRETKKIVRKYEDALYKKGRNAWQD